MWVNSGAPTSVEALPVPLKKQPFTPASGYVHFFVAHSSCHSSATWTDLSLHLSGPWNTKWLVGVGLSSVHTAVAVMVALQRLKCVELESGAVLPHRSCLSSSPSFTLELCCSRKRKPCSFYLPSLKSPRSKLNLSKMCFLLFWWEWEL